MSGLAVRLRRSIAQSGPITVAEYMALCLMDPQHGYYTNRDPFGAGGDFITAPEITQMFGELLGLSLAQAWIDQGRPQGVVLAELGPGRGTLMADALRATRGLPGFHAALSVHFVETSPNLRAVQAEQVMGAVWHDNLRDLPEGPLFLIANEFFDALPIRQFIRQGDGWAERMVGLAGDDLAFGLSTPAPLAALAHRLADTRDGDLVETCAPATEIAAEIGARIARHGGGALIVDYGDWHSLGDTLQALKQHKPIDPLAVPGDSDLTAHVDFEALALAAAPAIHSRLTPQGVFLERLGITARAEALARGLEGERLAAHVAAHRRLTHPAEMGDLFKVLGLYPQGAPVLPGLEP